MKAEIICIGDELLIGQTINTNASWLGDAFNKVGIRVHRVHTIPDDAESIRSTVEACLVNSTIVVVTGGLGPTKDDITKHTLCELFASKLIINAEALARIQDFMTMRKLPMLEVNRQQAALPHNCRVIQNHKGTACGMWFERNGSVLISMPGVPYEMHAMMSEEVIPSLVEQFTLPQILHRTLLTIGVGESFLAQTISEWESSLENDHIKLAYLPSPGSVKLRMSHYGGGSAEMAKVRMTTKESELRKLLGDTIFGADNELIADVVGQLLAKAGQTVAVAESCTGGYIGHMLTSVPGSSRYFSGGLLVYNNEAKTSQLGVDPDLITQFGVVSCPVAEAMAQRVREKFGTTYGIGITGIAGPDGGTNECPAGTVCIAISSPYRIKSYTETLGRSRERTILVASMYALNYLRKEILRTDAC